ncbi:MAG: M20/M25/M40 family metallo-hydrolase [Ilumatobacteraceae bacterium]
MARDLTGDTVELLQTLIRNQCVNDGHGDSGNETRNADVLQAYVQRPGVEIERFGPTPERQSFVARIPGTDPTAPSLCLMGHTDVVPVNPAGWREDPFGGEIIRSADGHDEVWGRGAVDMLNLTSSMAVVFRSLADRGFRPTGDLLYFAVADEEAGSKYGARWVADHHPDAIRCSYLLTESGGLHSGPEQNRTISVSVGEKGVAWRRLRITGTPGHGSMPFGADNALVTAAKIVTRLADYRPPPRFHELWRGQVASLGIPEEVQALLLDESRIDEVLDALPKDKGKGFLHACTHTTFSPNVAQTGERPKTNVIPDAVELDVDIRTMPGDSTEEVTAHLRAALGRSCSSRWTWRWSWTTPRRSAGWTRRCGTPCSERWRCRSPAPASIPSSRWDSPTRGSSGSSVRSATAPGCSPPSSIPASSACASTATTNGSTSRASG